MKIIGRRRKNENTAGTNIRAQKKSGHPRASLEIIVASLHRLNDIDDVRRENESISRIDMGSKLFSSICVEKDVIRTNLNSAANGTGGQSRNVDSTLKKSSESESCGDDTLKRSYRSVLIGRGK